MGGTVEGARRRRTTSPVERRPAMQSVDADHARPRASKLDRATRRDQVN